MTNFKTLNQFLK